MNGNIRWPGVLAVFLKFQREIFSAEYLGNSPDSGTHPRPFLSDGVVSDAVLMDGESQIQNMELSACALGYC